MNRQEAIDKLRAEQWRPVPGLETQVAGLEPRDAWGVARCFHAIYGAGYPIDTYYIPDQLVEANASGKVYSAVVRASNGDIVGHGALYRSSCPNPKVFEIGQMMVVPEYRDALLSIEIVRYLMEDAIRAARPVAVFGEAVCHHVMTQKLSIRDGFTDCALEIGLMPAESYPREEFASDRVSTVLQFRTFQDGRRDLYVPVRYREPLGYVLAGLNLDRTVQACDAAGAFAAATRIHPEHFDFAQVSRAQVHVAGADFDRVAQAFETEARSRGTRVLQFYLNLGEPAVQNAVELLSSQGYFFGGLLPHWFGTDGLLMQKVLDLPDFRSIRLYTERARRILDFVRCDLEAITRKE